MTDKMLKAVAWSNDFLNALNTYIDIPSAKHRCAIAQAAIDAMQPFIRQGWQPISEARKDGTHLLLFTEGFKKVRIGWFYNNAWHWDGDYEGTYLKPPTHFMLLPEPPKETNQPKE